MKKTVLTAISATAIIALSGCADEAGDEAVIESDAEEGVVVDLPDTPVEDTMVPAEPTGEPTDGTMVDPIDEDDMLDEPTMEPAPQ